MYKEKIAFRKLNAIFSFCNALSFLHHIKIRVPLFWETHGFFYSFLILPFDILVLPVVEYIKNKGTSYPICCLRHIPYDIPLSFIKQQT